MVDSAARSGIAPRELADWLLSQGRHAVTTAEAADLLGSPEGHVPPLLAELRRQHRIFSPTKGLYIAIPPEFRTWGAVPASHFIDALMSHLGHPYYVCLLSAAECHGFAHQRPQRFQVMTPARLRDRSFGRISIEFVHSRDVERRATQAINTPTGTMCVSTLATTMLDLVVYPGKSGSLSNVATIFGEILLDHAVNMTALVQAAAHYPASVVQRTGWLIDFMSLRLELNVDTEPLRPLAMVRTTPTPLDPSRGRDGDLDVRWNVLVSYLPEEEAS